MKITWIHYYIFLNKPLEYIGIEIYKAITEDKGSWL